MSPPCRILVCTHTRLGSGVASCGRHGGAGVLTAIQAEAAAGRLPVQVEVEVGTCFGHCTIGPNVKVVGGALLHHVSADDLTPVREAVEAWCSARTAAAR